MLLRATATTAIIALSGCAAEVPECGERLDVAELSMPQREALKHSIVHAHERCKQLRCEYRFVDAPASHQFAVRITAYRFNYEPRVCENAGTLATLLFDSTGRLLGGM